ncbi:hypothetical protein ADL00_38485 [Streptomyces sp. AS58]|uniref:hypothetical protein n=1 Tax=Streptomyces sp. AS58 TaxID=1519489 RepID=UPI0006AF15E6|nr:hypothetical protein [Streptomyces sp. AS58]KOV52055.1 hypothetical protein ADL00_38485 [Streptomyces sp. AS58]
MPKKNHTPHGPVPADVDRDHDATAATSWPRLVSTALLTGALRQMGGILVGVALAWWHHD